MHDLERMKELVSTLNQAALVYYQGKDEIMSNYEYDRLYDELLELEKSTNVVLSNSPTVHVGYETVSSLPKEAHISPMLSLDKTKHVEELRAKLGDHEGLLSLKLDGLSVILTYDGGVLTKALTRGNGQVGEVITNNARVFQNLPARIPYKKNLVIRGEALITYSDFEEMNEELKDVREQYKNPRNLCAGSVRQLNNQVTANRRVQFVAYNIIAREEPLETNRKEDGLLYLKEMGFEVVPYQRVTESTMEECVNHFAYEISHGLNYPSDGLVLTYDDIAYSRSLGTTAKFPRDSIAFKWKDEMEKTRLLEVEWSASRTGLINPVAIFEPVELEGTTVNRASVHNVSIVKELQLGIGDEILVYKANMIIPQIHENITKSNTLEIPETCPVCGEKTVVAKEQEAEFLQCINEECPAKKVKGFVHFVERDGMNIDGLSEATLEKLIQLGWLVRLEDLYELKNHAEEMKELEGFGEKSVANLLQAIEDSKDVYVENALYALGIKGIGLSVSKMIVKAYPGKLADLIGLSLEDLKKIDGMGEVLAQNYVEFFSKISNQTTVLKLSEIFHQELHETIENSKVSGKNFVITGSLDHFSNRKECQNRIEQQGGKVTSTVTSLTDYLVTNNPDSGSSKNQKARKLGVSILTEEELLSYLNV